MKITHTSPDNCGGLRRDGDETARLREVNYLSARVAAAKRLLTSSKIPGRLCVWLLRTEQRRPGRYLHLLRFTQVFKVLSAG